MRKNYWQGEKVTLRAFEEQDIDYYINNRNNPDSVTELFYDELLKPFAPETIRKNISENIEDLSKDDKSLFVIYTDDIPYVGEISVWHTVKKIGMFRYGIFLDSIHQGKGYGKDALIILLDFYFNELNYQKASPIVYSFNDPSQAFHEKCGFRLEGKIRNELYSRGRYHDLLYYGMLKDEFNELYKHF